MQTVHEKTYKFVVDDKHFETASPNLTGAQIKTLAQVDPAFQLWLEVPGEAHPDRQIADSASVNFAEPGIEKLYTVPPANFGHT